MASQSKLDDLVAGYLPDRVVESINGMTISVQEWLEWNAEKPRFRLLLTDKTVRLEVNIEMPFPRFAVLLTILSFLTGVGKSIPFHHIHNLLRFFH